MNTPYHLHTHINTHTQTILHYTCYKWPAGDYCISLSRLSLPLSSTSSNGRLILCCRICEPPLLSGPSTAARISVNQVKIWLEGEKEGRNKNVIVVHFLFTWMRISGIFKFWKRLSFLSVWLQKRLWILSHFPTLAFKWMGHGTEHTLYYTINHSYKPALWNTCVYSHGHNSQVSPSVRRLVLKRMAAITIHSTKLLKWCTYMSKHHKLLPLES